MRELLFGRSHHRNLGNRVDAIRNQVGRNVAADAKDVTTGESSLLHRGAGQRRKTDDIAGGINVRYRGPEIFIDDELAAPIGHQANRLQVQLIAVGLPSHGVKQRRAMDRLAALQLGEDAVAIVIEAHLHDLLAQPKHRPELAQLEAQALYDLAIDEVQQRGTLVEQRDLHAQRGEHRRILQSDDARAHDDQLARQIFQFVYLVGVEDAFAVDGNVALCARAGCRRR